MISIVTPSHDLRWLGETWASIKAQTFEDFEWLISVNEQRGDPGSVLQLARDALSIVGYDPRVSVVHDYSPYKGVGGKKQFAFSRAEGDILVELDHDDLLTPDALAELDQAFADPTVGFVYSDFADFDCTADTLQGSVTYRAPGVRDAWAGNGFSFYAADIAGVRPGTYECVRSLPPNARNVSHIYTAPNHVRAWRRNAYRMIGGHDPAYELCDDHELLVRTFLACKVVHIPRPLYLYRVSGQNTWAKNVEVIYRTSNVIQETSIERLVLRECELLGLPAFDLGGGINPRSGWVSVDRQSGDIDADLTKRWPWAYGSIGAFRAMDLIEHLPDKVHTMNEIHRCLRPGGWFLSMTPSTDGRGAFMDPTHVSYWNECAFWYWTRAEQAKYIRGVPLFSEMTLRTVFPSEWHQANNISYVQANLIRL